MLSALPTSDPYKSVIIESFEKFENPFTNLNTEWKRNKYFKEKDCRSEPDTFTDFSNGSYFKTHPLFTIKKHALQIQIYNDDLTTYNDETANPLGSKHGIHKIGYLYFIVRNLPSKFYSILINIYLLSFFHTQDLSKYSFDTGTVAKLYKNTGKSRIKSSIFR